MVLLLLVHFFFFVKAKHLDEHQERECPRADVLCGNRCGLRVPLGDMKLHYAESCAHRFVPCTLGCGYQIRAKVRGDECRWFRRTPSILKKQHGDTELGAAVLYHIIRAVLSLLYVRRQGSGKRSKLIHSRRFRCLTVLIYFAPTRRCAA